MHLTNYAVNKFEPGYQHGGAEEGQGSKRTVSGLLAALKAEGVDTAALWGRVTSLLQQATGALTTALLEHNAADAGSDAARDCFQIFGFDILLDADGAPHLLEVNDKPSMGYDSVMPTADLEVGFDSTDGSEQQKELFSAAAARLKAGGRECKCAAHPRPHVHRPCPVDLAVKAACLGDGLSMIRADMASRRAARAGGGAEAGAVEAAELAAGTSYDSLLG